MGCSLPCCGKCCSVTSVVSIIFVGVLASILAGDAMTLPIYDREARDKAYDACIGAIIAYCVTFVLSIGCIIYPRFKHNNRQDGFVSLDEDADIDVPANTVPGGEELEHHDHH
ncbi:MAG: hypothetical protein MHM6MM_004801 [Cercozoa sp. M6MM]